MLRESEKDEFRAWTGWRGKLHERDESLEFENRQHWDNTSKRESASDGRWMRKWD